MYSQINLSVLRVLFPLKKKKKKPEERNTESLKRQLKQNPLSFSPSNGSAEDFPPLLIISLGILDFWRILVIFFLLNKDLRLRSTSWTEYCSDSERRLRLRCSGRFLELERKVSSEKSQAKTAVASKAKYPGLSSPQKRLLEMLFLLLPFPDQLFGT